MEQPLYAFRSGSVSVRKSFEGKMGDRKDSDIPCVVFHDQAFVDLQRNLGPYRNRDQFTFKASGEKQLSIM
jgi:hypothetical protein